MAGPTKIETFDLGNSVQCDWCGDMYTDRDDVGGILFGSKAMCPPCVERTMPDIEKYGEQHYIRDRAREGETFRAFVLRLRDGNNAVTIKHFETVDDMIEDVHGLLGVTPNPYRKKEATMNYSTAIFLIDENVRAIAVSYEPVDLTKDTTQMKYTPAYLETGKPKDAIVMKTMDPGIAVNDYVIVPTNTRHGMTVCRVVATDFEIDFDSSEECHWIVGKVDTAPFEELRQKEAEILAQMKEAKALARRKKLAEEMKDKMDADKLASIPTLSGPGREEQAD